jgi:RNA recognition motif-containing protein
VFSSKLSLVEAGKNRGYGYVQFEEKESAEKALAQKIIKVNDTEMEVLPF